MDFPSQELIKRFVSRNKLQSSGRPWAVVHADLPCTNKGATQYNGPPLSRNGVANTAACQAICAASSACDFFSYSFSANKKCATYQGTCAEPDTSFVGDGYTTYAKFGKPWAVVHADLPCTNKGATQYNAPPSPGTVWPTPPPAKPSAQQARRATSSPTRSQPTKSAPPTTRAPARRGGRVMLVRATPPTQSRGWSCTPTCRVQPTELTKPNTTQPSPRTVWPTPPPAKPSAQQARRATSSPTRSQPTKSAPPTTRAPARRGEGSC